MAHRVPAADFRHIDMLTNSPMLIRIRGTKAMSAKLMKALLAVMIIGGIETAAVSPTQAHDRGGVAAGVAVGTLLGLGIAGAYDRPRYYAAEPYSYGPGCYVGPRHCDWVGRNCWYNRFGERVCGGGEWRCWRRRICH